MYQNVDMHETWYISSYYYAKSAHGPIFDFAALLCRAPLAHRERTLRVFGAFGNRAMEAR